ncbi:MAG: CPBP family intramembrane metalloprotease [Acidobacteria bacterium]|nr:CPBP family intramembrane metalloprotease [Acidobacteriota bacterium]
MRVAASLIRLTVFVVVTMVLWWCFAGVIHLIGVETIVTSALSLGSAVLLTTTMMMRIYEMQPFHMVGFFFNRAGAMHFMAGVVLGAGSSLIIVGIQWTFGWARVERVAFLSHGVLTLSFWFLILLVGAIGEELLFRGYGFQHLIKAFGPWLTLTSTSVLFAWMHSANPAFSRVGLINTALFGALFGYAYWRTRDLWLPLGLHFAWNFSLATIGANVSGLKIKLLGISMVSTGLPLWSGGEYGPEASLFTTFALVAMGVIVWRAPLVRQEQGILA